MEAVARLDEEHTDKMATLATPRTALPSVNAEAAARRVLADTRRIISWDGDVTHRWHAAQKDPAPVLVGDRPWDCAGAFVYGTVLHDRGRLRLWYQARSKVGGGNSHAVAYAESSDGRRWEKPDLGLVEFEGSRVNNLVNAAVHLPSVIRGGEADPRYWMVGHYSVPGTPAGPSGQLVPGVYRWYSEDGLRWERDAESPLWKSQRDSDSPYGHASDVNVVIYDAPRHRYLAATKYHFPYAGTHRRAFAIRTSADLSHWSAPRMALVPDEQDDRRARDMGAHHADFYGVTFHPYPEFIIGFVWLFYMTGEAGTGWPTARRLFGWSRHGHIAEIQPIFSYDGEYWVRPAGRPAFISTGDARGWDSANLATANLPVLIGDEQLHYYGGGPVYHGAFGKPPVSYRPETGVFTAIGLARLKRDRYASFSANVGGSVLVYHGVVAGAHLRVNARAPHGAVLAQVLDRSGNEVPGLGLADCVPFSGDAVDGEVRWQSADLSTVPPGEEVAFRFVLDEADLFAYEVA